MDNIQANPVEIIKKDIYKITDLTNGKIYIGQAKNTKERWKSHCKNKYNRDNSLIDRAIAKKGVSNFLLEIIESQIINYNEREQYWIAYYNCKTPYGYNQTYGGENPPIMTGINCPTASIKDEKILQKIKEDLKNSKLSLSKIAKKYNTNKKTVLRINQGISYADLTDEYPLRKEPNINGKLTQKQVLEIIEILKFSYRQYEDIARQYNVGINTIKEINTGKTHKQKNVQYPIRKYKNSGKPAVTYEQVTEIIYLLQNTKLSARTIAKLYDTNNNTINIINNGSSKRYRRDNLKYPLR